MLDYSSINWKSPDYPGIFRRRIEILQAIRSDPSILPSLRIFYRENPARFICDWGVTINPKNIERGLPSLVPFILYPKQIEWVEWAVGQWKGRKPGLTLKTRQMGFSWLSMALACTMCIFNEGMVIGFGSRKQEYVDLKGDLKSLIEKGRSFMANLPVEFRAGWSQETSPHMRMMFPESSSLIAGEAGDNIGRGATTSIYFVDEAAFIERPHLVEASLSQTTNCRIDISTPNGRANPFADKFFGGKISTFEFFWRDDPTKDQAWFDEQAQTLDPVTLAQEITGDFNASVEGVVIPAAWVQAAVDAHLKLQFAPTGAKMAGLDIADEGIDKNALCGAHGVVIERTEEWSGKGKDIFDTVERAFLAADLHGYTAVKFDSDGLGAGARGDARVINDRRRASGAREIKFQPFRGSAAVVDPKGEDVKDRKNEDFFANAKAQGWWRLRTRFQKTYRAVVEGMKYDPDELISISSAAGAVSKLCIELSQATYSINTAGKIVIDKAPDGQKSPNLADAVMIRFSPLAATSLNINPLALARA